MVSRQEVGKESFRKGKDFETIMKESWKKVPGSWRLRIKDGGGGESPGDDIILLDKIRLLVEYKTTDKPVFSISGALKNNQIYGGLAFMGLHPNNVSLVVINFERYKAVYALTMRELTQYIHDTGRMSLSVLHAKERGREIKLTNEYYDLNTFLKDSGYEYNT